MINLDHSSFEKISLFKELPVAIQNELAELSLVYSFTFQQRKQFCDISADLYCWGEKGIISLIKNNDPHLTDKKEQANRVYGQVITGYESIRSSVKNYNHFHTGSLADRLDESRRDFPEIEKVNPDGSIMGRCPVASEKTRCCNLNTLDAVWQCGFECSYCSIQSFYYGNRVRFVENLPERLKKLSFELESDKKYHIGTGQSSDSLMWGNRNHLLENLTDFATDNPNVLLEMKSKSSNINWFKKNPAPGNMAFTWSLNTPEVIRVEEGGTASLDQRLNAARFMADKKSPVGFHFHPMVYYDHWKEDYRATVENVTTLFKPQEVMMISIGTLTFIKPVIKKIRKRLLPSRILQMPMEDIAGKLSYSYEIKKEMFSYLYSLFPKEWKESVFFYFCMEDIGLWDDVFGFSYSDNDKFEEAMLQHYFKFIDQ